MSCTRDSDDQALDVFASDVSSRNSDIGFQPSGIQAVELLYNAAVFDLHIHNIPGPFEFEESAAKRKCIGAGAQFEVFGAKALVDPSFPPFDAPNSSMVAYGPARSPPPTSETRLVAIKRAKIFELQDVSGSRVSLKTRSSSHFEFDHIHLLKTEVEVLTRHQHPNLVKLLAWGYESQVGQSANLKFQSLVLVIEHAMGSAMDVLQFTDLPWSTRKHLCGGVVAGIKKLHSCSIVHGDVKPENVLIFETTTVECGLIAKIADFNSSWSGAASSTVPLGTLGWAAPEIHHYDSKTPDLREKLISADVWSLGLTVGSILIAKGCCFTQMEADQYASEVLSKLSNSGLSSYEYERIKAPLTSMLQADASLRPRRLDALRLALQVSETELSVAQQSEPLRNLTDLLTAKYDGIDDLLVLRPNLTEPILPEPKTPLREERNSWLHSRGGITHPSSDKNRHLHISEGSLPRLFELALGSDNRSGCPNIIELEAMLECASRGYYPAQGLCAALWKTEGRCLPLNVSNFVDRWNFNAVASGYRFSPWSFEDPKPLLYRQALDIFRQNGGYNLHYCGKHMAYWDSLQPEHDESVSGLVGLLRRDLQDYPIHLAAALNTPNLEEMLPRKCSAALVLAVDHRGDTPLMKCCMAGHIEALRVLVRMGAHAAQVNHLFGYTAIQWLFTFPDEHVEEAVSLLAQAGAIFSHRNAKAFSSFHMPFGWPCGNLLHWAVFANNVTAANAIVQHDKSTLLQVDFLGHTALDIALQMLNAPMVAMLLDSGASLKGAGLRNTHEIFELGEMSISSSSSGWAVDPRSTPVHNFLTTDFLVGNEEDREYPFSAIYLPPKYRIAVFTGGDFIANIRRVLQVITQHSPDCLWWTDFGEFFPLHYLVANIAPDVSTEALEAILDYGPGFHEVHDDQPSPLNLLFINKDYALKDEALSKLLKQRLGKVPTHLCSLFLNQWHPLPSHVEPATLVYPTIDRYRPVHFAAELGLVETLRVLIALGADPLLQTEDGHKTALDVAVAAAHYTLPPQPRYLSSESSSSIDSQYDYGEIERIMRQHISQLQSDVDEGTSEGLASHEEQRDDPNLTQSPQLANGPGVGLPPNREYHNFLESLDKCSEGRSKCIEILEQIKGKIVPEVDTESTGIR